MEKKEKKKNDTLGKVKKVATNSLSNLFPIEFCNIFFKELKRKFFSFNFFEISEIEF